MRHKQDLPQKVDRSGRTPGAQSIGSGWIVCQHERTVCASAASSTSETARARPERMCRVGVSYVSQYAPVQMCPHAHQQSTCTRRVVAGHIPGVLRRTVTCLPRALKYSMACSFKYCPMSNPASPGPHCPPSSTCPAGASSPRSDPARGSRVGSLPMHSSIEPPTGWRAWGFSASCCCHFFTSSSAAPSSTTMTQ